MWTKIIKYKIKIIVAVLFVFITAEILTLSNSVERGSSAAVNRFPTRQEILRL
jgi:hypothetical protein